MTDKRSRYSVSARDRQSSIGGDTSRNNNENFAAEFLKYAEEYNVDPLPKIILIPMDYHHSNNVLAIPERIEDKGVPVFQFTYRNRKLVNPVKIESKGYEISMCMLDALSSTMQKCNTITVLKLPDCKINAFGIVQIAEMLTNFGCIEELNLDMNPNSQENYHLLCTPAGSLKYLSLKLCKITDDGMKKISNELVYRNPPDDPKLVILNLANNHITKDGAACVGNMLRTNRSLRCLVLLGNRICDEGASLILQELQIITLKHEEIVELRRIKFAELALLDESMENKESDGVDKVITEELLKKHTKSRVRQSLTKRSKRSFQESLSKIRSQGSVFQDPDSKQRIRTILEHDKCHPFRNESFPINGEIMATGNLYLQYLDLSYNHMTKNTLNQLIGCLYYQAYMLLGDTSKGLLHILFEGGDIKEENAEDWGLFESVLQQRQRGKSVTIDGCISEEIKVLRQHVNPS